MSKLYRTALTDFNYTFNNSGSDVTLQEQRNLAYITLRGDLNNNDFVAACLSNNITLPKANLEVAFNKDESIVTLWLSPDEFLLVTDASNKDTVVQQLKKYLVNIFAAVVDNSGGYTQLKLTGCKANLVLSKLSFYDFSDVGFYDNKVITTNLAETPVHIYKYKKNYYLVLRTSFAYSILKQICRAADEYSCSIL